MLRCLTFSISFLFDGSDLANTVKWETYPVVDMKIFRKLVEVVSEHAVEVTVVFNPGKLESSFVSNRGFLAMQVEMRIALQSKNSYYNICRGRTYAKKLRFLRKK